VEQDVVECFAPLFGSSDEDAQVVHDLRLPAELVEFFWPERFFYLLFVAGHVLAGGVEIRVLHFT
jgi:hypothetical protein